MTIIVVFLPTHFNKNNIVKTKKFVQLLLLCHVYTIYHNILHYTLHL